MTTQLRPVQLTLLLLFITAISLQAQWTTTGTNITSLGKVGIGIASTVTPANELHLKAIGSGNTWADMTFESTAGKQWSLSGRDDRFSLVNWTNSTTTKDYLTILDGSGYIGIGISNINTSAYLDIIDNNAAPGTRFLEIGNEAYLTDVDVPNILGIYGQANNASGGIELGSSGPTLFGSSAGYLGIGTTLPGALLHVAGGDLRVDGRIAIGGNMNTLAGVALSVNGWSDDIFDSKYQLKDLDEVEEYIKKHKHLPSIPSEKEIMEKGLDTGEMLKLQMAKIEEITLYMIELKKENNAMKEENKEMKKAIEALKK